MGERAALIAAIVLVPVASGCDAEPTRIVVVAETDLEVPREIDGLSFVVDARAIGGDVDTRDVDLVASGAALPLVLPVVHDGGALGPVVVRARALLGGRVVVERSARLSFVARRSLTLVLRLEARCAGRAGECADDQTCVAGECMSHAVESAGLSDWSGGGLRDAGVFGTPDAGAPAGADDD